MVRLFQVYYPVRTLVLLAGETVIVCLSFLLAALIRYGPDSYLVLNYERGFYKIVAISALLLIYFYYFDLYAPLQLTSRQETFFRLFLVLGTLSFSLAVVGYCFPELMFGRHVCSFGLIILTGAILLWRGAYMWLLRQPYLRERVYVLGSGERAARLVETIRTRRDVGMEVVGWAGSLVDGAADHRSLANAIRGLLGSTSVDRLVLAVSDMRDTLPLADLLHLRLDGVRIEDANSFLERITGKIDVDNLRPSSLIYSDGFRLGTRSLFLLRVMSFTIAALALLVWLPLIVLVAIAVKVFSAGSILIRQNRVGRGGKIFTLYKFRTMRQNAEVGGAVWAKRDDPRITGIGRLLRTTRLDEVPQLWNVLIGDMGFVGPRPERPEFVQRLEEQIPYYNLRHSIRPGITGWAQVRYRYGASLEQAQEKLRYDLYYIKHVSVSLDLFIIFKTIKTVLLGRGAQ
jgi:sugar transferase (PEP-CTERM system associated)